MLDIPQSFILTDDNTPFPALELALKEPNGLIAIGGELTTKRLIDAYQNGIFPWYDEHSPVLWYSPNPRMILTPETLHVSKNLKKILKKNSFRVSVNQDFDSVIRLCKTIQRKHQTGTWIDENMLRAYTILHQKNIAHSIEVYQDSVLVGGLYGVSMGKVFFGESMFSKVANASKIALVYLLQSKKYELVDCQVESPHLKSLGAFNIQRSAFIKMMKNLL